MDDLFVLEYDVINNEWHVEKIKSMLSINKEVFLSGRLVAFIPVAIASSLEEINKIKIQMIASQKMTYSLNL